MTPPSPTVSQSNLRSCSNLGLPFLCLQAALQSKIFGAASAIALHLPISGTLLSARAGGMMGSIGPLTLALCCRNSHPTPHGSLTASMYCKHGMLLLRQRLESDLYLVSPICCKVCTGADWELHCGLGTLLRSQGEKPFAKVPLDLFCKKAPQDPESMQSSTRFCNTWCSVNASSPCADQ